MVTDTYPERPRESTRGTLRSMRDPRWIQSQRSADTEPVKIITHSFYILNENWHQANNTGETLVAGRGTGNWWHQHATKVMIQTGHHVGWLLGEKHGDFTYVKEKHHPPIKWLTWHKIKWDLGAPELVFQQQSSQLYFANGIPDITEISLSVSQMV